MHRFSKRLLFAPESAQEVYSLLTQIENLKGQWKAGSKLSPQALTRLRRSVVVTSTGASTRIEGAKLSDEEVEKLLKGLKIQKLKTRDEQEVAGYAELLLNVFESYPDMKLSENTLKHLHHELLKYSEKDQRHRGSYKFGSNRVEAKDASGKVLSVLFDPTPPPLVQKEILELLEWTNGAFESKTLHPLLIIANFVFEFLSIHPFQDGNGRCSRILTNLLLLKKDYTFAPYISHEKLIEDHKNEYYLALNKAQKTWKTKKENVLPWLHFFLKMLLRQTELAVGLMHSEVIEHLLSEKQLSVWIYIQKNKTVSPKKLREALGLPTPTVQQILKKLLVLNKIERLGEGRASHYRISSSL
jgi:Fic family protein